MGYQIQLLALQRTCPESHHVPGEIHTTTIVWAQRWWGVTPRSAVLSIALVAPVLRTASKMDLHIPSCSQVLQAGSGHSADQLQQIHEAVPYKSP